MAEKDQQAYHPATTNGYTRSGDVESTTAQAKEIRRQKIKKWIIYGVAFAVFQTLIIVLFTLTIMKVRNPKFRVRSAAFDNSTIPAAANTSFTLQTDVTLGIKNTNFGPYKYDSTTIDFYFGETKVGNATIPKSKAQFRRTKKVVVPVGLTLPANSYSSGIITLRSQSTLNGKVELMFIFKKKKAVNMDCTMEVHTANQALQNIQCK
ncbi:hypothetical protein Vadar_007944 [Vaccinium darrowii]|uniref:Uncharacterized protein n=1 Tax=Vaccinium darrowii TaxID=229202 RepID=A0ACB7XGA0_9ERIC|nr:hypothetical protein Vadar_007944 [Vaccinium darrowii]